MDVEVAGAGDVQRVTETMADAFAADPVWGWAFPDPAALEVWWRFWIAAAVPQGWVLMLPGAAAAASWIPPGGRECPPEDEPHLDALVRALAGARAPLIAETLDRFEQHVPHDEPHFYLSLLATASPHRGRGLGMALLAENLGRIDALGLPAYLESTNPANLARYESVGFRPRDQFDLPEGNAVVTTMWRPSGGA